MGVDDKLAEAEYFLGRMKQTYPKDEFVFELSAFLSATRSIPDYLLEDYNQTFALSIPLSEKLYPGIFEKAAKKQNNKTAEAFIAMWKQEMDSVEKDPIGSVLTSKRHLSVHREKARPDRAEVTIHEVIRAHDIVTVQKYDAQGKLVQVIKSPDEPLVEVPVPMDEKKWCFKEVPSKDVISVCQQYLDLIKAFVQKLQSRFS